MTEEYLRIDGFDFGIEADSRVAAIIPSTGRLHIEVRGSTDVMDRLVDEQHEWGDISYPPHLNIFNVDYHLDDGIVRSNEELDPGSGESEVYLYALSHRRLQPFEVTINQGLVTVTGTVHALTEKGPLPLEASFQTDFSIAGLSA